MLLFLCEDEHGWLYEPHGVEPDVWTLTAEGGEVLRSSGWKPYEMPRVSRHVHESLLIDGFLLPGCKTTSRSSGLESDPPYNQNEPWRLSLPGPSRT